MEFWMSVSKLMLSLPASKIARTRATSCFSTSGRSNPDARTTTFDEAA